MSPERSWKQRIIRTLGAVFVVGSAGLCAEARPAYSSFNKQQSQEALDAAQIVSEVAGLLRTKDISTLIRFIDRTNFNWINFKGNNVWRRDKEWAQDELLGILREALSGNSSCVGFVEVSRSQGQSYSIIFKDFNSSVNEAPRFGAVSVSTELRAEEFKAHDPNKPLVVTIPGYKGWKIIQISEYSEEEFKRYFTERDLSRYAPCVGSSVQTEAKPAVGQGEALSTETEPRRFIVYQSGLTTPVDNSGSAAGKIQMFESIQDRLHKGHDRANIINASKGYSFNSNGNYVAGSTDCEQSLDHPYERGVTQANIIIELLRRHPNSYFISINHSAGGNAAMEAMAHMKFLFVRGDITQDILQRVNFVTAHSPIQGVSRNWIAEVRKFGIWQCTVAGMPDTNSPAYRYLRELWDDRVETRKRLEALVLWFRSQRDEKKMGSGVYGLVNVPDGVIAPAQTLGFWNKFFLPIAYLKGDPLAEEILTQEIPGGQNFRRYISDGGLNHSSFFSTKEGIDFIAKLVGS